MTQATNPHPLARHGGLSYLEIPASNPRQSATFYRHTLHWNIPAPETNSDTDPIKFFTPDGLLLGRFIPTRPASSTAGFLPFFYVSDIHAALKAATTHQGIILKPITPEGDLLLATLQDPASNTLGLWQFANP